MQNIIVVAGVVVEAGRVLLAQRKPDAHLGGMWEFPGGKLEPLEDPREGLKRELAEELGVSVEVGEVLDVAFHKYEEAGRAVLLLFFRAHRVPGSPDPRALDVAAFEWAGTEALDPGRFPPADLGVLDKVRALLAR